MYFKRSLFLIFTLLASHHQIVFTRVTIGALVIDVQKDFLDREDAALPVADADTEYVDAVDLFLRFLRDLDIHAIHTQDYHTLDNISFAQNCGKDKKGNLVQPFTLDAKDGKMKWPVHCVQGTSGSEIVVLHSSDTVVPKGTNPLYDSYSGFEDDGGAKTILRTILQKMGIIHVITFGLATNYCVRATVIDGAKSIDYPIISHVVINFCRSVIAQDAPGTYESEIAALKEMHAHGARLYFIDSPQAYTPRVKALLDALTDKICIVDSQEELIALVKKIAQEETTHSE